VIAGLIQSLSEDPEEVLLAFVGEDRPSRVAAARESLGLDGVAIDAALDRLEQKGKLVIFSGAGPSAERWAVGAQRWSTTVQRARELVGEYHQRRPLRSGMSLEELRGQLAGGAPELIGEMVNRGMLRQAGGLISLPEFVIRLSQAEAEQVSRLLERFEAEPFGPPGWSECRETVGEEILASLLENGELVRVSETVLLSRQAYSQMTDWVRERLGETGKVTVGEVRDRFVSSRKYALALLEHLDQIGVTARDGEFHRQSPAAGN